MPCQNRMSRYFRPDPPPKRYTLRASLSPGVLFIGWWVVSALYYWLIVLGAFPALVRACGWQGGISHWWHLVVWALPLGWAVSLTEETGESYDGFHSKSLLSDAEQFLLALPFLLGALHLYLVP